MIGHTYGPDSQEQMDNLLRLDRTLGRLLDEAERRAGQGRVLVVLTADHGVMPLVEVLKAKGIDARRASGEELTRAGGEGARRALPRRQAASSPTPTPRSTCSTARRSPARA